MEEKNLKVLKLNEITELIGTIFLALFGIIAIISVINGYGIFRFIYTIGVMLVLLLPPILCVISGIIIMILRKLNYVKIDGDWGILNLIVSVYSVIYSKEDSAPNDTFPEQSHGLPLYSYASTWVVNKQIHAKPFQRLLPTGWGFG